MERIFPKAHYISSPENVRLPPMPNGLTVIYSGYSNMAVMNFTKTNRSIVTDVQACYNT